MNLLLAENIDGKSTRGAGRRTIAKKIARANIVQGKPLASFASLLIRYSKGTEFGPATFRC